jgi:uncharacterized YccA/Bax inhibitor family protein
VPTKLSLGSTSERRHVRAIKMTQRANLRQRLGGASIAKQVFAIIVALAIPLIVGVIAACITPRGRCVDPNFFVVCATVGPLVGLALFIDIAVVINQVFVAKQGLTRANKALGRILVYANAGLMTLSESFALFAVASGRPSTFLVTVVVSPLVLQVWLLTEAALFKINALEPASG